MENVIVKIHHALGDSTQHEVLSAECAAPQWTHLPTICFEACIENPFVLDLMSSESYQLELREQKQKGSNATTQQSSSANTQIGVLCGMLTHLLIQ